MQIPTTSPTFTHSHAMEGRSKIEGTRDEPIGDIVGSELHALAQKALDACARAPRTTHAATVLAEEGRKGHWHPVFASLETLTFPSSENDEVDNGDPREHCRNPSDLPIFTGPASIAHGVGRTSHRPSQRGGPPGL
ncbi:hypothetical protein G6F32_014299 [Rhizopus arrhizus]|nr:hypothetical protein G6F32_014299 [Rhizopus arrhizus]